MHECIQIHILEQIYTCVYIDIKVATQNLIDVLEYTYEQHIRIGEDTDKLIYKS